MAFLLPAMIHTEYQLIPRSERKGPNVLVLAPTRELALQIEKGWFYLLFSFWIVRIGFMLYGFFKIELFFILKTKQQ